MNCLTYFLGKVFFFVGFFLWGGGELFVSNQRTGLRTCISFCISCIVHCIHRLLCELAWDHAVHEDENTLVE